MRHLDEIGLNHANIYGAKACSLAEARRRGLPALPGFCVALNEAIEEPWELLNTLGTSLIVRSSSMEEDTQTSSGAGRFNSVLNVTSVEQLLSAVETVRASGGVSESQETDYKGLIPVLVQPMLKMRAGGVAMYERREETILIEAARGGPHTIVQGAGYPDRFSGNRTKHLFPRLGRDSRRRWRSRALTNGDHPFAISRDELETISTLASQSSDIIVFDVDIEWGIDCAGNLYLLQARPLTRHPLEL